MTSPTIDTQGTPPPPLRQKITLRSWELIRNAVANAAGAARRAPGALGARGLAALRKLARADPTDVLGMLRSARRLAPGSAFLAQGTAIMTARVKGWDAAAPLFAEACARKTPAAAAGLLRQRPDPAIWPALPAPGRPACLDEARAGRIVIYTTAFGAARGPAPRFHTLPGLRFLCLTDRADLAIPGWRTVVVAPPVAGADRAAAWARILPHRALAEAAPDAEASLYLAADRGLIGNIHTLMLRWLLPHDLVFWRSGAGIDWQDLAEHHLITADVGSGAGSGAAAPAIDRVIAQARDCAARGVPRDLGAYDTGMIWRRHAAPAVAALMEAWWETDSRLPGLDAISLYAAVNDPAAEGAAGGGAERTRRLARILPAALGKAANNAFVAAAPPRPARRPRGATPPPAGRPLPVAFVYAEKYAMGAATVLRGKQLSEMVAARYPDAIDMLYTSDLAGLRDRVVVLTKNALDVHSASEIDDLRKRNLAVIGSWDDKLPDAERMAATDASMAVSNRQAYEFGRRFPATPAYHVTHHVNSQIRPMTPPTDRLRAGYFGYPANTYRPDSLGHLVDFVGLNTSKVDMSWLDLLPNYNCHWIVRRNKPHDGGKPFLKGFVAARCQAVLAVGRGDEDAVQYLGDDYPFYMRSTDAKQLEYDMMALAAAFGGPEWRRAQEIMAQVAARSTDAQVCAEFRAMVEDVIR